MYRRSSLTFSSLLLKEIANGRSRETAFGIQRAVAFAHQILAMPHVIPDEYVIKDDFTPISRGAAERAFFAKEMNGGVDLRSQMMSAYRITTFLSISNHPNLPNSCISLSMCGFAKGEKSSTFELNSLFHHRFGDLISLNFEMSPGRQFHSLKLTMCEDCHERAKYGASICHRPGCPYLKPGNINERLEYERGADDGYRRREEQLGGQNYHLGYDIGGLTYQADLALGRISPSL